MDCQRSIIQTEHVQPGNREMLQYDMKSGKQLNFMILWTELETSLILQEQPRMLNLSKENIHGKTI